MVQNRNKCITHAQDKKPILRKNVRKNVRKKVRKNVRKNVRKKVRKNLRKNVRKNVRKIYLRKKQYTNTWCNK